MNALRNSLGETLTRLRRGSGLTQARVAELLCSRGLDIRPAGVSKWEKGQTMPNAEQFLALCDIYSVQDVMSEFTGSGGLLAGLNAEGRALVYGYARVLKLCGLYGEQKRSSRTLPLYSLAASAGTGQFLDDESSEPIDAEAAPEGADFAVRIAGDSMEPEIPDGCTVWVRRRETLEDGRVGIFVRDGEAFCKRLQRDENGAYLASVNPKYAPIRLGGDSSVAVCGEVVGMFQPEKV